MSLDPAAVAAANSAVWAAHPELGGRQLSPDPADAALRQEWMAAYQGELAKKPPAPVVAPVAPVAPVALPVVMGCAAAPSPPVSVSNCKDVASKVQEGDILLRGERGDAESDFLGKVSGCKYSHAGMVARNAKGDLVAVDAYPGRGAAGSANKKAVGEQSLDDFFCGHGATHGLVARPKDCAKAQKAAQWAMAQTADPDYEFNLWDPWNNDPKQLYCADFVHQSFENAGVELVPVKMDLLDAAHYETSISEARKMAAQDDKRAKLASDKRIEAELRRRTGGSSEYVTPCQVAVNSEADTAVVYDSAGAGSGGSGKKSGP